VGDAGIPYADEYDLAEKLQRVLRDSSLVHSYRNRAQIRVKKYYDWDRIVDQYEQLFADMAGVFIPRHESIVLVEEHPPAARVAASSSGSV